MPPESQAARSWLAELRARPALQCILSLKALESCSYFLSSLQLPLYLSSPSEPFRATDTEAGWILGAWGVASGVASIALGPAIDVLGVRRSLLLGSSCGLIGRLLVAGASRSAHLYAGLFIFQPLGAALGIPVLSVWLRRSAPPEHSAALFGAFYSAMNVAALLAGLLADATGAEGARLSMWLAVGGAVLFCGTVAILAAGSLLPGPLSVAPSEGAAPKEEGGPRRRFCEEPLQRCGDAAKDAIYRRMVVLSAVLWGARSVFRHADATLPKWMLRTLGKGSHYGLLYAVNPAIIIVAVPPLQAWLRNSDPYDTIWAGTLLTACAPWMLALCPPGYWPILGFELLLSLGEAVWAPRLYEFMLRLSPPGREGSYGSLVAAPLFLVGLLSSAAGGSLLAAYCPPGRQRGAAAFAERCSEVWLIVGCIAASTPLAMYLLRDWYQGARIRAAYDARREGGAGEDSERV